MASKNSLTPYKQWDTLVGEANFAKTCDVHCLFESIHYVGECKRFGKDPESLDAFKPHLTFIKEQLEYMYDHNLTTWSHKTFEDTDVSDDE